MVPLCAGRRAALRLCSVLPPTGGAGSLLRSVILPPAARHSSGGDRGEAEGTPPLPRHRRAWGRRSLSPLERISSMIPPELLSREVQELQGEGGDTQLPPPSSASYPGDGMRRASSYTPGNASHEEPDNGEVNGTSHPSSTPEGYSSHEEQNEGLSGQNKSYKVFAAPKPPPGLGHVRVIDTPHPSTKDYAIHGHPNHRLPKQGKSFKVNDAPNRPSSSPGYSSHEEPDEGLSGQNKSYKVFAAPKPPPGLIHVGVIDTPHPSTKDYAIHGHPTHRLSKSFKVNVAPNSPSSSPGYSSHEEPDEGLSGQDSSYKVFAAPKPPSPPSRYTTNGELGHVGVIDTPHPSTKDYATHGHPYHRLPKQDKSFKVNAPNHPSSSPGDSHEEPDNGGVNRTSHLSSTPEGYSTHEEPEEGLSGQDSSYRVFAAPEFPPSSVPDAQEEGSASPSLGTPFTPGDLLLAEYKRRHYSMFRKMFVLKEHGKLVSNWGAIGNQEIVGKLPGQRLRTSTGHDFLLRRPSLEEFVGYMKRGPNIAYPKDITAMMTMMDVNPGDVVLEAGSGSGAISLFLSRAVGAEGCIYSFDIRADHHEIAKKNFQTWRRAWRIRSGRSWPDNVRFINKSVLDAAPDIAPVAFDSAVLDMLNPQTALPVITGNLKQGAVCAVYIANITQVIDLLEAIRSGRLPLLCERVVEVGLTQWLVAPARRKDGSPSQRVDPFAPEQQAADGENREETDEEEESSAGSQAFGQLPYIARPLPWQTGHTAFLLQLRKFKPASPTEPEDFM